MLAAATLLAFATLASVDQAVAQTALYERPRQNGISEFSHDATLRAQGWRRVVFPAREERAYTRPPRASQAQRREAFEPYFQEAARLFVLPLAYLTAVASVESGFDSEVISVDGAMGVMQLMPFTAKRMGVKDAFNPRQNILGGARFLRILANQWKGDLRLTTAAYNAGSGAVAKYGGIPPFRETQRYVAKVLSAYRRQRDRPSPIVLPLVLVTLNATENAHE